MTVLVVPDDGDEIWPTLGPRVCDWIEENLVFGPGDLRGEPAVLDDEKRGLIYRAYEIYPEDHKDAGRRRFKRAGFSLAKGKAKTEMAAWIAAAELHAEAPVRCVGWENGEPIGGGVTDPYVALVAYTEEQSDELAYGALKAILEESRVADDFDIGLERIMRIRGDGKAVSLSNSPSARDGARTTFQVADETHWWTTDKLKRAHQTMLANIPKRKIADAWALEVTTAFEPGMGSVAEDTMEYARAIHEGRAKDARLFYFHRQASEEHDMETEEGVRAAVLEASGPSADWRDIDSIVEMWRDPTTDRRFFERVWCNRPVQSTRKAFDLKRYRELKKAITVPSGSLITVGFDGAQFHDATAIVCTDIKTGHQWLAGIWECPYGQDNWQVPAQEVDEVMDGLFETYNVWRMYGDPPYWQSWFATWEGRYGQERVFEWWTNRRRQMAAALENYETAIVDGALSHDGNEDLIRHVGNAHRHNLPQRGDEAKPLWLIRKDQSESPHKIDAAMAAVLSWEARTDAISLGVSGESGTVFSKGQIKYWTEEPKGGNRYILVCAANDKKPNPAITAMLVVDLGEDKTYRLIEIVRADLNLTERTDLLFEFHRKHDPVKVVYEKRGHEGDIGHIEDRQTRENYRFRVESIDSKLSENERIMRLLPLAEQERIVLPEKHGRDGGHMTEIFVGQEFVPYPYSAHCDLLDCLSRILDCRAEFPSETTYKAPEVFESEWE